MNKTYKQSKPCYLQVVRIEQNDIIKACKILQSKICINDAQSVRRIILHVFNNANIYINFCTNLRNVFYLI